MANNPMNPLKLYAVATTLAVVTATVSLTAAPAAAQAAEQTIPESKVGDVAVLPLIALAAGGLAGAFLLGAAQGYAEAKNAQQGGNNHGGEPRASFYTPDLDYVLD